MDHLAPPLECVLEIKWALANNHSFREALRQYLNHASNEFSRQVNAWAIKKAHGQTFDSQEIKSPYRRHLLLLFERAWMGEPIGERLNEMEAEIRAACEEELQLFVQKLPFISMLPVLLFQVPAYLLLLLGPVLGELLHSFQLGGHP